MFEYTSQKQLSIFDFHTDFESKLNPENQWVKMANMLDWDKLPAVYAKKLSPTMGAGTIDARIVISALIIKHLEKKDDRETIEIIRENTYMQYFLGLDHFTDKPVFDPSLFVGIRKRLGNEAYDEMNRIIISGALEIEDHAIDIERNIHIPVNTRDEVIPAIGEGTSATAPLARVANKGKLQLYATVCDAYIKFTTDMNLLNQGRKRAEELLSIFVKKLHIKPPRTYKSMWQGKSI